MELKIGKMREARSESGAGFLRHKYWESHGYGLESAARIPNTGLYAQGACPVTQKSNSDNSAQWKQTAWPLFTRSSPQSQGSR
jgi:hypothetical protein